MKSFKEFLLEYNYLKSPSWQRIMSDKASYETIEDFFEIYNDKLYDMFQEMINGIKQKWNLIKYNELKMIYDQHKELGFVKNEKLLDKVIDKCVNNLSQLMINNLLSGHTPHSAYEEYKQRYEECNVELTEEEFEKLAYNYVPYDKISDYGTDWAFRVVTKLMEEDDDNKKIILLNHLMNIVHQRSDFAEFFVEGGISTLKKLSDSDYGIEIEQQMKSFKEII